MSQTTPTLKVIFAGTPDFAATQLAALLDSKHQVTGVLTQPDRPAGRGRRLQPSAVKVLAQAHNLPYAQPETLKSFDLAATFDVPDVIVVAAYGLWIPRKILDAPRYGCINVHTSLLPRWRGASPVASAILAGDTITGITIMQMTAGMDEGPILRQASIPITTEDTTATLEEKLANIGAKSLCETLDHIETDLRAATPQASAEVTHATKFSKSDALIDFSDKAAVIARQIRAFQPWPISYFIHHEQRIRVWAAITRPDFSADAPGTIIAVDKNAIWVKTGDGAIGLTAMQLPGKKSMSAAAICNGHPTLGQVGKPIAGMVQ